MNKYLYIILIILCGCTLPKTSGELEISYGDFEKYKIKTIVSSDSSLSINQEKYFLSSSDSSYYNPRERSATRIVKNYYPGCFEKSWSKETIYLDLTFRSYLMVYFDKENEVTRFSFLKSLQNKLIDSLLTIPGIQVGQTIHQLDKEITVFKDEVMLDSTVRLIENGLPIIQINYFTQLKKDKHSFDTTYYFYPRRGLQIIKNKENIDSIFTTQKKIKTIVYNTKYGSKKIYNKIYSNNQLIKTEYIGYQTKDIHTYKYKGKKLIEEKQFRNDTLRRKIVYGYSNDLIQNIFTYNFQCTTKVHKSEIVGYQKMGNDSLPLINGLGYDSIYFDYNVKPDIINYKYTFFKE